MMNRPSSSTVPPLELWGGVECTVNRVGNRYFDQLEWNGHCHRLDDLDRFARLGIRAIRYPVLWERVAPKGLAAADWKWTDERLGRLRALGIRPIVGLVHHGSGPLGTSLMDAGFAVGLAQFARAVAARYPWIEDYTPVNEPLTTARFSGLYGHWYPHGQSDATFVRALLTQCRAIVLAMRAIRDVNSAARLIQTEDLGKTFSTPSLAYQAEFENIRRLLSLDLLCGLIDSDHPMWNYLLHSGALESELAFFRDAPHRPDVIGLNYYLTSDRLLDERLDRYPDWSHGGNGKHSYADIEAVRVWGPGISGHHALVMRLWERYHRPVAITEAHLGCTREEQLRWLMETWEAAQSARRDGVDVRAVTVWSLLGAHHWNTLVVRCDGRYEPGVYDLRGPHPRPTALAAMMNRLAAGKRYEHPVLACPGWWRRRNRFHYPEVAPHRHKNLQRPVVAHRCLSARLHRKPLLIIGATGTLGRAFARLCAVRGIPYFLASRKMMDIADANSIEEALLRLEPWAVVNAAGYVRVDDAESDWDRCHRENTVGPAHLASACRTRNLPFLTFSSDLVFDGSRITPYVESHPVSPLCAYGRSKAEAEQQVLGIFPCALVIRTSAFFGPWDENNFVTVALRHLSKGDPLLAADDTVVSPTYVPDLVHACLDLLIDGEHGMWHLANQGAVTWAELARQSAAMAGLDGRLVQERNMASLGLPALRPQYSVLGSERGSLLPSLNESLQQYLAERGK
jgi:dTDP-4-dehydrorhamnose reductase